jgi:hypothetical protein
MNNYAKKLKREINKLESLYYKNRVFYEGQEYKKIHRIIEKEYNGNIKIRNKRKIMNTFRETILIRLISALEVYLIDIVRESFLYIPDVFLSNNKKANFTDSDIIRSVDIITLQESIVNKKLREIHNSGFDSIMLLLIKRLKLEEKMIVPSLSVMKKYHDIRHLLVHTLGATDYQFRHQYNTDVEKIFIDHDFLEKAFSDFRKFFMSLQRQVDALFITPRRMRSSKTKNIIEYEIQVTGYEDNLIDNDYMFIENDIIIHSGELIKKIVYKDNKKCTLILSGSRKKIEIYLSKLKFNSTVLKYLNPLLDDIEFHKYDPITKRYKKLYASSKYIDLVRNSLPGQPWNKGIHKEIGKKLDIPYKQVSRAIDYLIYLKEFKDQVDGKLIDLTT